MKRTEFIQKLRAELSGLAPAEIEDIIRDQNELIDCGLEKGRVEEEIIASLGDPKLLAKSLKSQSLIVKAEGPLPLPEKLVVFCKMFFTLLVLTPFNMIFLAVPLAIGSAIWVAGWAVSVSLIISGITVLFAGFGVGAVTFVPTVLSSLPLAGFALAGTGAVVFAGAGILFMGAASSIVMLGLTIATFKLLTKYFKWNLELVTAAQKKNAL